MDFVGLYVECVGYLYRKEGGREQRRGAMGSLVGAVERSFVLLLLIVLGRIYSSPPAPELYFCSPAKLSTLSYQPTPARFCQVDLATRPPLLPLLHLLHSSKLLFSTDRHSGAQKELHSRRGRSAGVKAEEQSFVEQVEEDAGVSGEEIKPVVKPEPME